MLLAFVTAIAVPATSDALVSRQPPPPSPAEKKRDPDGLCGDTPPRR
jgi:hypothetical protein